jgi:hypothetical protein
MILTYLVIPALAAENTNQNERIDTLEPTHPTLTNRMRDYHVQVSDDK